MSFLNPEQVEAQALNLLTALLPLELPDDLVGHAARDVTETVTKIDCGQQVSADNLGELYARAFALGSAFRRCANDDAPTVKNNTELAHRLFDACVGLFHGTPADGPLPANPHHVTKHEGLIRFYRCPGEALTNGSALLLGVWLIALADPTLSDAVPMLLRVATR